jgi:hypothetical protein
MLLGSRAPLVVPDAKCPVPGVPHRNFGLFKDVLRLLKIVRSYARPISMSTLDWNKHWPIYEMRSRRGANARLMSTHFIQAH